MLLQGDMHTHTIASTHAYSTILENCQYAHQYGLEGIAMTDHAMGMPDSPHIWHFENLKCLPRKIANVTVLRGIEADILADGTLDIHEQLQKKLEWVVASMHSCTITPTTIEDHTKAYLKICENPYVDVIGHCTTNSFMFDYEKCVKAFKEYEKLVEINESSLRNKNSSRENCIEMLRLCKKYETPVVFDSDSHFCQSVGQTPLVIKLAEEIDFPQKLIVNCDWNKIREYVLKKRPTLDI